MIPKKVLLLGIPIMVALFFASCKEQTVVPVDESMLPANKPHTKAVSTLQGVPYFDSFNTFDSVAQLVGEMTAAQRTAYEQSTNYKSYGTICDSAYENLHALAIALEKQNLTGARLLSAKTRLQRLISASPYLQYVVEDGNTYVETDEYDNADRYMMDSKKMYVINDEAFRYFDTVQVVVAKSNMSTLRNASDPGCVPSSIVLRSISKMRYTTKVSDAQIAAVTTNQYRVTEESVNGSYRLRVKMYARVLYFWGRTQLRHYCIVKNYHKSWGWWWPKRLQTTGTVQFKTVFDDQINASIGNTSQYCLFTFGSSFMTRIDYKKLNFMTDQVATSPNLRINSYICSISNSKGCSINK